MLENKEISEELEEIAPNLSRLKNKQDAFKLPDNYFATLETSILKQVKKEELPLRSNNRSLYRVGGLLRAIAAIFVLGGISLFLWKQPITNTTDTSLSSAEISSYIQDNLSEFEEELFSEEKLMSDLIIISDLNETEIAIGIEDILEELEEVDLEDLL